jgi:hypothetical protein
MTGNRERASQSVIVTGGGGIIGRATVERLAASGCDVLAVDVNATTLADIERSVRTGGPVSTFVANVVDPVQVAAATEKALSLFGAINGLVNVAGGAGRRPPPEAVRSGIDGCEHGATLNQVRRPAGSSFFPRPVGNRTPGFAKLLSRPAEDLTAGRKSNARHRRSHTSDNLSVYCAANRKIVQSSQDSDIGRRKVDGSAGSRLGRLQVAQLKMQRCLMVMPRRVEWIGCHRLFRPLERRRHIATPSR